MNPLQTILDNLHYIEQELPNQRRIDEPTKQRIAKAVAEFAVVVENMARHKETDALAPLLPQLQDHIENLDDLARDLMRLSDENDAYTMTAVLVGESATNIFNAFTEINSHIRRDA